MIVSRKAVVWSGIAIVILFAIVNRVEAYRHSDVVWADVKRVFSEKNDYMYCLSFEYQEKSYIDYHPFSSAVDTTKKMKLLIPDNNPGEVILFTFFDFFFAAIVMCILISGLWIMYLESFFPKNKIFYFFTKKEESDE